MSGLVLNIVLFFWIGLSLAFFIEVDAEVFTILSAAAIAGLLTYMSVFISDRNADIEKKKTMIKEMKDLSWDYIELINDFFTKAKTYKHLKDELLEEMNIYKRNYDSFGYNIFTNMAFYVNSGTNESTRDSSILKEISRLKQRRDEYKEKGRGDYNRYVEIIREKTDFFSSLKVRLATKGERLVDVCMVYGYSYLPEDERVFHKEIRHHSRYIINSVETVWQGLNKESTYKFDIPMIENIEKSKTKIRVELANLEAESERMKEASEVKRNIYISVLGTIFICLGYVVSKGYA